MLIRLDYTALAKENSYLDLICDHIDTFVQDDLEVFGVEVAQA